MRLDAVDFSRPPRSQPVLGWVLLAIGVVVLAAGMGWAWHAAHEREAAEREAEARFQAARARRPAAAPKVPTPSDRRAAQAVHHLAQPWNAALRAVETVTADPVYLLSLQLERSTGGVKLEGEAPRYEDVVAYVDRLQSVGGLASVALQSHDTVVDPNTGRQSVRFAATAQWGAR